MHQLTHPVATRRIIVELHSEWGLPPTFFADVRRLRTMYEPLGFVFFNTPSHLFYGNCFANILHNKRAFR